MTAAMAVTEVSKRRSARKRPEQRALVALMRGGADDGMAADFRAAGARYIHENIAPSLRWYVTGGLASIGKARIGAMQCVEHAFHAFVRCLRGTRAALAPLPVPYNQYLQPCGPRAESSTPRLS
jgi:hypothetical protein